MWSGWPPSAPSRPATSGTPTGPPTPEPPHSITAPVVVTELARVRWFYGEVLGLKEIPKPKTFDFIALWYDLGGGHTLHLLQKDRPDPPSPRHFCLRVADARAARAHFARHGVRITETGPIPGAERFFVADPDGNRVEILQWLAPYDPAVSGAAELDR